MAGPKIDFLDFLQKRPVRVHSFRVWHGKFSHFAFMDSRLENASSHYSTCTP